MLEQTGREERQGAMVKNKNLMEAAERDHKNAVEAVRRENKVSMKQAKAEHQLLCQDIEVCFASTAYAVVNDSIH